MLNRRHVEEMTKLRAELCKIASKTDGWITSIVTTTYASFGRCVECPDSPFYKELVAQTSTTSDMMLILLELADKDCPELVKILEKAMELSTELNGI